MKRASKKGNEERCVTEIDKDKKQQNVSLTISSQKIYSQNSWFINVKRGLFHMMSASKGGGGSQPDLLWRRRMGVENFKNNKI